MAASDPASAVDSAVRRLIPPDLPSVRAASLVAMPKVDPEVTAGVSGPGSEDEGDSGNVPRSQGRPKMKGLKPILRVSPLEDGGSSKLPGDKSGEGVEETETGNGSLFLLGTAINVHYQ